MKKKDILSLSDKKRILSAAACLFKPKQILRPDFIDALDQYALKQAYLTVLKTQHPSKHPTDSIGMRQERITFLQNSHRAFEYLNLYLKKEQPKEKEKSQNCMIAVGGAKGGIGKSLFAANLAVVLCQQGYRVVSMDLDLGGANLSLYMGEKFVLDRTINDFLHKRFNSLEEIMCKCKHGPMLIGGDSSELGMANIAHTQKLKLIRNIQNLDTDFVILDLGGDTSYNMLDFFLMADYGFVMTTKDSASYIGAYQFLKTALYRKLNRLTGPEAGSSHIKSSTLANLLKKATTAKNNGIQSIVDLCTYIDEINPLFTPLVLRPILLFNPFLIVNKVTKVHQATQSGMAIGALCEKALAINLPLAGHISRNDEIEDNLRNFEPVTANTPKGKMATEINAIIQKSGLILGE